MATHVTTARFQALKRQATRQMRARPELTRAQALDQIAREQGFENWSLLARVVEDATTTPPAEASPKTYLMLRCILRNPETGRRLRSWDEPIEAKHPKRRYQACQWVPENFQIDLDDEGAARDRIARTRRIVSFMDATNLKRSKAVNRLFGRGPLVPGGFDHTCIWRDDSRRYLVTTELCTDGDLVSDFTAWCEDKGWELRALPKGYGIWNPCRAGCRPDCRGHTQMLLLSPPRIGIDVSIVERALLGDDVRAR